MAGGLFGGFVGAAEGDGGGCGAGHCASGAGAVGSHHARYFLAPPTVH